MKESIQLIEWGHFVEWEPVMTSRRSRTLHTCPSFSEFWLLSWTNQQARQSPQLAVLGCGKPKSPIVRYRYYMRKRKTLNPELPASTSKQKLPLFWNRYSPVVLVERSLLELNSVIKKPGKHVCEVGVCNVFKSRIISVFVKWENTSKLVYE